MCFLTLTSLPVFEDFTIYTDNFFLFQPYYTVDSTTAYFVSRNDIYLVLGNAPRPPLQSPSCPHTASGAHKASSPRTALHLPAIVALDFLSSLFDLLCSLLRLSPENLDAKALLTHQILALEVLDEVVAKGQIQVMSPDKIRNLIYRYSKKLLLCS